MDFIKAELKFVTITSGAQCVMTAGMIGMLEWLVDNWDFHHLVCHQIPMAIMMMLTPTINFSRRFCIKPEFY